MDETSREYAKYLAAKYAAGTLRDYEITLLVDLFTDKGIWVDSFLDIMDADWKTIETLSPIFKKCLSELGIRVPPRGEYLWWLICYHLNHIVAEKVTPIEGITALKDDTWDDPELDSEAYIAATPFNERRFGGSHDVFHFVSFYWQWDDIQERHFDYSEAETKRFRQEIEEGIRQEARTWLTEHNEVCD